MKIDIGIPGDDRKQVVDGLSHLLADTYTLYLKTQNFHWNVTGPMFRTLHNMFEEQYQALAEANDTIAERIRALGGVAPGTYEEFGRLTSIEEHDGRMPAKQMIMDAVHGHETCVRTARKMLPTVEGAKDEATLDLLTERLASHEKTAWMLRSLVEE
ncbi:MAG: Dps family protein [Myxococcota bacterium]